MGNDITPGQTFADGSTYPASTFNSAIADAVIKPGFLSAKNQRVVGSLAATDLTLVSDNPGLALYKATLGDLQSFLNASQTNATPSVATTLSADVNASSTTLVVTNGGSVTNGMLVAVNGVPATTTVSSGGGTNTLTISVATTSKIPSGASVLFYPSSTQMVTAGIAGAIASAVVAALPQLPKAWVSFARKTTNGPATINASFNVASVTRVGTGQYTIVFTNAMKDANYCICGATTANYGQTVNINSTTYDVAPVSKTTSQVQITVGLPSGNNDPYETNVAIFGN